MSRFSRRVPITGVIASIAAIATALALSACGQKEPQAETAASTEKIPYRPTASIQDLMLSVVDPSADFVWESVAVITSESGTEERQPRTDEEWAEVRAHAITLIEAANLLMMPGRVVAHPGKTLQDEGAEGVLNGKQIQSLIDADHTAFASRALALHDAGVAALEAIDKKDATALSNVGGVIDEACEQCHTTYWYPSTPPVNAAPAEGTATP